MRPVGPRGAVVGALGPGWSEGSRWGMAISLACREAVRVKAAVLRLTDGSSQTLLTVWASRKHPLWVLGSEVVLSEESSVCFFCGSQARAGCVSGLYP